MINLIVDSNIIFSAIMTSGKIYRRIIFLRNVNLFAPEEILFEFHEHSRKLKSKNFDRAVFLIFSKINILPLEFYKEKISEAYEIAKQFDPKDTPFIALSLKLGFPIWTGDKDLIKYGLKTGKYIAIDTDSLEKIMSGCSFPEVIAYLRKKYLKDSEIL